MADHCALRLIRELKQLQSSDQLAIAVHFKEENICDITALLVGPPGTPYELGFYEFAIKVPSSYPAKPPMVTIKTTDHGCTRFGPNLYATGKVCLSIIGTWHGSRGEEWSPAQGLESVLLSIQSLLSANPYTNEPGFEQASGATDHTLMENYNAKIRHENLRLAVIAPLERAFGNVPVISQQSYISDRSQVQDEGKRTSREPETDDIPTSPFDDYRKQRFLWYYDLYQNNIEAGILDEEIHHKVFPLMQFEARGNAMEGRWSYPDLKKRLQWLQDKVLEETHSWPAEGLDLEKKDAGIAVNLRGHHEQIVSNLRHYTASMVDLTLVNGNPFLWKLTYFGRPMSKLDGGVFNIKIYISPRHPAEQPRVFVETPLYHIRVSRLGVLIYTPSRADEMSRHIEGIINALEDENPPYNPLMTVHPEATKLCWGSDQERRQYRTKLRRSVEKSAE
ncbi:hypothetical protein NUU61_005968 [Penicillium alfredii]|uniref:Ubiquitin-conjugating enzyme E2 Z n=1 Tax=Penicillium alfredii TaxID=1506179 RepID=A0A9W9F040_9EURO|nr:uncharacterized protein NUU61_005968 [Penicillium alfredii]KAJ5091098.1 hypothetical protein NUU61_005968 [Penicillium alfredii]